jgi:hypothetical protein
MTVEELEWWPDYGHVLLWRQDGTTVQLESLDLRNDLRNRLSAWLGAYDDESLPLETPGDSTWVNEGRRLLKDVRDALQAEYAITVTEPWWEQS